MFDFTLLTTAPLVWAALAFVAAYMSLQIAIKRKWLRPVRSPSHSAIYYAGAPVVAITILFAAPPLFGEPLLLAGLAAAGFICIVGGILDEERALRPSYQLILQIVAASCVVTAGWTISYISQPTGEGVIVFNPWVGGFLAVGWLLLLMNAMNWLDGVDGLATGVGGVALATLAAVSLLPSVQDPLTLALSLIGVAVVVGFLLWNFPPALVHLGTSGSWWLGLFIGIVAIVGGGKIVTTLLVLALPVVDVLLVTVGRISAKQPLWQGDQVHHLHHRLLRRGWPPRAITVTAIVVTVVFGVGAIVLQTEQKIVALIVAAILVLIAGSALALTPRAGRSKRSVPIVAAITAIGMLVVLVVSRSPQPCRNFTEGRVRIGDTTWSVALSDTPSEYSQGLMNCDRLPPNSGMYFIFPQPTVRPFWMKNMIIPIDIIWIAEEEIVGIEKNVPIVGDDPQPPLYYSPQPYTAVLELPAGEAARFAISVGQEVILER